MKEINIAKSIVNKRKEKGLTQDELANYLGVSKASVSKWETGLSYPDIAILPKLATYFNTTIDELMNYEPQLTKQEIRKLYSDLTKDFNNLPMDEVLIKCKDIIKKYYSCYPLLFQIAALLVNNSMRGENAETTAQIIEEAKRLLKYVKSNSKDAELAKQAQLLEGYCLLVQNRPNEVVALIDKEEISLTSTEPLLASAYEMIGNVAEAKSIFQVGIYKNIMSLLNLMPSYLKLCKQDKKTYEEALKRTFAIVDAFNVDNLHPTILMPIYISVARYSIDLGDKEKALEFLKKYADLATGNIYPLKLHGDEYFYMLDDWLENTLTLGTDLPRDEREIKRSITQSVEKNPIFEELKEEPAFIKIVERLKKNEDN